MSITTTIGTSQHVRGILVGVGRSQPSEVSFHVQFAKGRIWPEDPGIVRLLFTVQGQV